MVAKSVWAQLCHRVPFPFHKFHKSWRISSGIDFGISDCERMPKEVLVMNRVVACGIIENPSRDFRINGGT